MSTSAPESASFGTLIQSGQPFASIPAAIARYFSTKTGCSTAAMFCRAFPCRSASGSPRRAGARLAKAPQTQPERTLPATARQHFKEDIARAKTIVTHADPLPRATAAEQLLRSDLLRGAVDVRRRAMDGYFCDAYTDLITGTISSKSRQPEIVLPECFFEMKVTIRAILDEYENPNWRWRNAAREMMEGEKVLSLATIQVLFNKFFREDQQFFGGLLDTWMSRPEAKIRMFSVSPVDYNAMNPPNKGKAPSRRSSGSRSGSRLSFSTVTTASTGATDRRPPPRPWTKALPCCTSSRMSNSWSCAVTSTSIRSFANSSLAWDAIR